MGITYQSFRRALFLTMEGARNAALKWKPKGGSFDIKQVRRGTAQGFEIVLINSDGSYLGHVGLD